MPTAAVTATSRFSSSNGTGTARVTLKNPGNTLAFFMRMQITGRGDEEALPVLWEDNYVSLLPGETRTISATYAVRDLGGSPPRLLVTGWNVRRVTAR
jgi:exo-1,4-beta-D-glucosaminidase